MSHTPSLGRSNKQKMVRKSKDEEEGGEAVTPGSILSYYYDLDLCQLFKSKVVDVTVIELFGLH